MSRYAVGKHTTVIGAGVVGITTALKLQQQGMQVTVLDPLGPGEGTSCGNAGFMATELIDPLSTLASLCLAPRLWLNPHGAVALPLQYLPRLMPWLTRFIAAAHPDRVAQVRQAQSALNKEAVIAWKRCLVSIGAEEELVASGYFLVWESKRGRATARAQMAHLQRWGHKVEWLEAKEISKREPGLSCRLSHGLYFSDAHQVRDPLLLVRRLAKAFEALGGLILRSKVEHLVPLTRGVQMKTTDGEVQSDQVVVATGAWSHYLARDLGLKVPLETERGYHLTLPERSEALRQPVGSAERRCVMTPMSCGLRVVGFTELGGLSLHPIKRRYSSLRRHARALLANDQGLDDTATEWMGFRPTLPDSLPVIDTHPNYPAVHFAFGHQHLGLTQAAITAELVSSLVMAQSQPLSLEPYRVTRFR